MKATQNPFHINIGFLINQPIGYSRDIPFEFKEFELENDLFFHELVGKITLIRTQDGFRGQGIFDGMVDGECGRCLETYQEKIHMEFEEFFTFSFVETSDNEIQVPEDGNVDFVPIFHDYVIMELPIKPVCREDCKGLCDICGVNLNHESCGHVHEETNRETLKNRLDFDSVKKALKP